MTDRLTPGNPDWMHRVNDCSPSSVSELVQLLRSSTKEEHWLYREAELDDLWRHAEMELQQVKTVQSSNVQLVEAYEDLWRTAFSAHNLAAAGALEEAATALERARDQLERASTATARK